MSRPPPPKPSRRWWAHLAVGAAGGALVGLSLPPFGWWPLGWAGFALAAWRLGGAGPRQRAALGAGLGGCQYCIGLWWVREFSVPGAVALVVVSSAFWVGAAVAVPAGRPWGVAAGLPCASVAADWVRDRFPLHGFPLGAASLGQAAGPLAPAARLGGSLLVTAATVLAGVALAGLASWLAPPPAALRGSTARRPCGLARAGALASGTAVLAAAAPVCGLLSPSGAGGHLPPLRVALVQGGGPRGTRAISTDPQVVFDRHLEASSALQPPLDLVVWPEGVLQSHGAFQATQGSAELAALARRLGATVVAGVEQDVPPDRYVNEVVAWGPQGAVVGRYRKNHLVPFGEYVPFRSVVGRFFDLSEVPYDGIPGHSAGYLPTPAAPLAVMISYEVFFDERARGGVRHGGQVLVVPTNTASYRSSQVPAQELAAARLRAVETGRWLVQVTPTGYSAVVSPDGRVVERSALGRRQVLYAEVPRRTGRTVYVEVGDLAPVSLAAGGLCAAWALQLRRRLRERAGR